MQNQKITQTKIKTSPSERELKEANTGFKVHLAVTVGVSSLLTVINMLTLPHFPWFLFPTCGMSIGVIIHYIGIRSFRKKAQNQN